MKETVNDILAFKDSREKRIREFINEKTTVGNIAIYKIFIALLIILIVLLYARIFGFCICPDKMKCSCCFKNIMNISIIVVSALCIISLYWAIFARRIKKLVSTCHLMLLEKERHLFHYAEWFALKEKLKSIQNDIDNIDSEIKIYNMKKTKIYKVHNSHIITANETYKLIKEYEEQKANNNLLSSESKQLLKDMIETIEKKDYFRECFYQNILDSDSEKIKIENKKQRLLNEEVEFRARKMQLAYWKYPSFDEMSHNLYAKIIRIVNKKKYMRSVVKTELKILFSELIQKASQLKNPDM